MNHTYSTLFNNERTHIYYDTLITNVSNPAVQPIQLQYEDTQTNVLVRNPSDYEFSIIRFSSDTSTLPVFNPLMDLTSSDNINPNPTVPSPTIYTITLTYTDITGIVYMSSQTPVLWTPEYVNGGLPQNVAPSDGVLGYQDNSTGCYFCFSYQYWITKVNSAFVQAYHLLVSNYYDATGQSFPVANPPFFNGMFIMHAIAILNVPLGLESAGYLTTWSNGNLYIPDPNLNLNPSNYNQINIVFNTPMYILFNSLPAYQINYGSTVDNLFPLSYNSTTDSYNYQTLSVPGGNVQLIINSYGGANLVNLQTNPFNTTTTSFIQVSQEYSTVPAWNPVVSIVFTSNTIPVSAEALGTPSIYNGSNGYINSSNNRIIQTITDFQSQNAGYRGFIQYTPTIYRYIDLNSNSPLSCISLNVYWRDKFSNLQPFVLQIGGTLSIKLLFKLKDGIL